MKEVFLAILKILAFLFILPLIIASIIAFQGQILSLPLQKEVWVLWGAGVYVGLNLFVFDFKNVYVFGNSLAEKMMPFLKGAGYVVPVYVIILIVLNVIAWILGRASTLQPYFLFAIAFMLTMQVVLTAHEIYQADKSILKAHYLITFGAILVVALFIASLLLAWAIPEYSIIGFIKSLSHHAVHLYRAVFHALFVDSA